MDFSIYFDEMQKRYQVNHQIFRQARTGIEDIITRTDGVPSLGSDFEKAIFLMDTLLGKNMFTIIDTLHLQTEHGAQPSLDGLDEAFVADLLDFAHFLGPLLKNTLEERKATERQAIVALKAFKAAILSKPSKPARLLSDWITKWSSYIQQEYAFRPDKLKAYKQREIILVDFGFNVDGEFGGRHYAVVLEKNNNPRSSVILVAPITSYDPSKGETPHPAGIDLGIGAIHGYPKGAYVVINQIRYISKMRIESPKSTAVHPIYMNFDKFQSLSERIRNRITPR